jgi:hypothetical protein
MTSGEVHLDEDEAGLVSHPAPNAAKTGES